MSALARRIGACVTVSVCARVLPMARLLIALLVWAAASGAVHAQVTFQLKVIDGNGPSKVWGKGAGDLDGDGKVDVIAGSNNGGLYWYQNPTWTKRTISSGAKIEEDMEVVDLDKDGRRDIVSVTTGGVTWFRNTGTGWTATVLVTGLDIHDIEVKDLDGDGKLDLIGRNQGSTGNILYFWRQGASLATWTRTTTTLPEGGEGLLAVDLDRNGKVDVAVGKYWFKNGSTAGALSFTRYTYNAGAEKNAYIAAGKINGDSYVDLVVTPSEPKGGVGDIAWYLAPATTTNGWTKRVIQAGVESVHHFVGVADFDQDGDNDVATAMTHVGTNPKVKLFYNTDGKGTFGPASIVANTSSHSMKIVDLANNGLKSLYGANYGNTGATEIDLWQASAATPAPVAVADSAATNANEAVTIAVLANDSGTGLTVSAVTMPANGTTAINAGQTVTYTPNAGYTGGDSFQYTIKDSTNRTASASVAVTVRNRIPVAGDDTATTQAGTAVTIPVLANDSDPDGHALTVTAVTDPANGTAAIDSARAAVVYTPDAGFSGTDSFDYTISDGHGGTDQGTVTVTATATATLTYIGCFRDYFPRDLAAIQILDYTRMTIPMCQQICANGNYRYMGVQDGGACFCDNHYGTYGPSTNCGKPCVGDRTTICGGTGANDVYRLP